MDLGRLYLTVHPSSKYLGRRILVASSSFVGYGGDAFASQQQVMRGNAVHDETSAHVSENEGENRPIPKVQQPRRRRKTYQSSMAISPDAETDSKALEPYERAGASQVQPVTDHQVSRSQRAAGQQLARQEDEDNQQIQMHDKGDDSGLKLRLELNLEIELELKAQIHGDLTLALLS
ncbi:hypothetical protein UA08_02201 [Talaromyces atroroseus]|uniref:Uncharacterized protein n=1 Tax=Talaromyces atroroseus TaxID=1441469 RepID=A0A225B4P6_TALAT|nr:hypothetical protein UA08_02201 [Talaromyces atroroseus]OKL62246.1 hypothetical protein UA08_02201 [Talaromyces atroroseus]